MNGVDIVILDYRFCKLSFICIKEIFTITCGERIYTHNLIK